MFNRLEKDVFMVQVISSTLYLYNQTVARTHAVKPIQPYRCKFC